MAPRPPKGAAARAGGMMTDVGVPGRLPQRHHLRLRPAGSGTLFHHQARAPRHVAHLKAVVGFLPHPTQVGGFMERS